MFTGTVGIVIPGPSKGTGQVLYHVPVQDIARRRITVREPGPVHQVG